MQEGVPADFHKLGAGNKMEQGVLFLSGVVRVVVQEWSLGGVSGKERAGEAVSQSSVWVVQEGLRLPRSLRSGSPPRQWQRSVRPPPVGMSANRRPESIVDAIQHSGGVTTTIITTRWSLEVTGLISLFFWGSRP